ncbi:hypothetical protein J2741_000555 [Methanolinea mesophila]|uniref:hypothetical protein n=1 Tax=Methanolinea mesophila TaxID=547055 RepID=UPI001AE323EC|nr:hypothetical protein [Methanolinea mesophila]MBP1928008.1 hypothetical protein [Methanolinea mesophila]
MAYLRWKLLAVLALVIGACSFAGCLSLGIGDVSYSDGGINVQFNNEGNSTIRILKITVYRVDNFTQHEVLQRSELISLKPGESALFIPMPLENGSYKFYMSLSTGDERRYVVIRDVEVG